MEEDGWGEGVSLTAKERAKWPWVVLVDPAGLRGAAYNSVHQLVVPEVSPALLRFALERATQRLPWDDALDDRPRPRAAWMPTGSLQGWQLCWVRTDASSAEHLRAMPKR